MYIQLIKKLTLFSISNNVRVTSLDLSSALIKNLLKSLLSIILKICEKKVFIYLKLGYLIRRLEFVISTLKYTLITYFRSKSESV